MGTTTSALEYQAKLVRLKPSHHIQRHLTTTACPNIEMESTTGFTGSAFDFFKLPQELRNRIYTFLMATPERDFDDRIIRVGEQGALSRHNRSSSLLRTCKIVYEEALPILMASLVLAASGFVQMRDGLNTIGVYAQTFITTLFILQEGFPDVRILKVNKEIIGLGLRPAPLQYFPVLPTLKLVALVFEQPYKLRPHGPRTCPLVAEPPHQSYLEKLIASKLMPGHGLFDLMSTVAERDQINWRLSFSSNRYGYIRTTSARSDRWTRHWGVKNMERTMFSIETQEVVVDGQASRRMALKQLIEQRL